MLRNSTERTGGKTLKIQITFEIFDEYLKIHISGENPYAEIEEIIATIKRLADENNRAKVLVDTMKISGLSEMEKYFAGEQGAKVLGHKIKTAVVSQPEKINKFMETVAVNRGARLRVFGTEPEALNWLLK
jgi:hypothetical protein